MGQQTVVVLAGGERALRTTLDLPPGALIIAADSGVDYAHSLGLLVDVAIGDFDSISTDGLDRAQAQGARIERHPSAKDETDLELALDEAVRLGATDIIVLGIGGGRLDHLLANMLLLASPKFAASQINARDGRACVAVVHGGAPPTLLTGAVGELLTLLPVGGVAAGITTSGLRYPLNGESLAPGTSRGVSNVIDTLPATVQLDEGVLLAVLPGEGDSNA